MQTRRIHITGASGSGVTTLGRALADALALPHHDTDDYLWLPTAPPYRKLRPAGDRLRLMQEVFLPRADWVLSGALDGWGDALMARFDAVVFLQAPNEVRIARLRDRETRHFGAEAVAPGGWRHAETEEFIDWAAHYEDGTREGRCLARQEAWLAMLPCPVVRLDGMRPTRDLVREVATAIGVE
ncbi:MAG TPA: AAA family ATPase [Xanthobacteraceae bacterium]